MEEKGLFVLVVGGNAVGVVSQNYQGLGRGMDGGSW